MNVGLPGTGLGSLFYLCLVLYMPFRELYFMSRGRSSLARWKTVGFQWILLSFIMLSMWLEGIILTNTVRWVKNSDTWLGLWLSDVTATQPTFNAFGQFAVVMSFIVLGAVCLFMFLLCLASKAGLIQPNNAVPALAHE